MQKRRFLMFLLRVYTNLPEWLVNIRLTLYSVLIFSLPGLIQFKYVIDHTRYSFIISRDSVHYKLSKFIFLALL